MGRARVCCWEHQEGRGCSEGGREGFCSLAVAAWRARPTSDAAWPTALSVQVVSQPSPVLPLKGPIHPKCFGNTHQLDRGKRPAPPPHPGQLDTLVMVLAGREGDGAFGLLDLGPSTRCSPAPQ